MAKNALVEHRPWLLASIAAAIAFYFLRDNPIGGVWLILLKGAGVSLLLAYALRRASGANAWLLAGYLALCAAGDMAIELDEFAGGALFLTGHLVAIALYLRNRRHQTVATQRVLAVCLVIAAPGISYLLSGSLPVAIYAVGLGLMAGLAWMSRFSRYRVGIGAVLFVISDWLIFSQMGNTNLGAIPHLAIWPLYYLGQFLIATGVVQTLRGDLPSAK
ncbi:MAG: lysoplasmalogenase [Erythrobacter sp.]